MSADANRCEAVTSETRKYLPWLVAVALFMENLDATIVNTAVPTMSASLGVEPLSLKAVLTSYTLSLAVFIPISGWLADRFGTCRIFRLAVALFMLGSLACGLAPNVPMLVGARILQGIGGAMMTPVGRLALVRSFPRSEMIRTMNFVVIPALLGPLIGPFAGGVIVHWVSWRVIFFVNIPLALFGLWMIKRYMPDFRDEHVAPLDRTGFVLFGAGIALLSYVLEVFGEHTLPGQDIVIMGALSVGLLAAYGWHARRDEAPVLDLSLFRVRTFRLSVAGGFVTRLGIGGMPFLLPLLYQIGLGFAPWQAGLLIMPQALAAMGMKLISRPVLARLGHRTILLVNTVLLGLTIMVFTQIGPGTPWWAIVLLSFTQGFFSSLQFTSMNSLVYADVNDRKASRQQHRQHGPTALAQLRCRVRLAPRRLVPRPCRPARSRAGGPRAAQGVLHPRLSHDPLLADVLGTASRRWQQRQQPPLAPRPRHGGQHRRRRRRTRREVAPPAMRSPLASASPAAISAQLRALSSGLRATCDPRAAARSAAGISRSAPARTSCPD